MSSLKLDRFQPIYECVIDPEFPGDGNWQAPVYAYLRTGRQGSVNAEQFKSQLGPPLVVRITIPAETGWVGFFESGGGLFGMTEALACPNSGHFCAIAGGQAYLVDVTHPEAGARFDQGLISSAQAFPDRGLLILLMDDHLVAIGPEGVRWVSKRLCHSDLELISVEGNRLECHGSERMGDVRFAVDARTGRKIERPELRLKPSSEVSFARTADRRIAAQFLAPLQVAGLRPVWRQIVNLARPSARFIVAAQPSGASKLGGRPDVANGFEWPRDARGKALSFLAQIDLAEVHRVCRNDLLPETGLLGFFYDAPEWPAGLQPGDRGRWAVTYAEDEHHLADLPVGVSKKETFDAVPLMARGELTLPASDALEVERLHLDRLQTTAYDSIHDRVERQHVPETMHRVLGWADGIQRDPTLNVQRPANRVDGIEPNIFDSEDAQRPSEQRSIWLLLFQIDSEEAAGMLWGDNGRLYFMIREADLRARAWDKVWLNLQDY